MVLKRLITLLEELQLNIIIGLTSKKIEQGRADFLTFYSRATARWKK